MNLYLINPDRNLSDDINAEQDLYFINPDRNLSNIINAEHDLYHCASYIQGNSNSVYCKIDISSYSLEIVNTLNIPKRIQEVLRKKELNTLY